MKEESSRQEVEEHKAFSGKFEEGGGAPGVTRTRGTQIRNLVLYPPELRGHKKDGDWDKTRSPEYHTFVTFQPNCQAF